MSISKKLWLYLEVNPEPWAVGPLQVVRRGGKVSAFMGRNQQLANYQDAVREAVRKEWGELPPLEGKIELTAYFWRQQAEYRTPTSRQHRKHEADATNMLKALEDALQGVLYKNDRDNVAVHGYVMGQDENTDGKMVLCLEVVDQEEIRYEIVEYLFPAHIRSKVKAPPQIAHGDDLVWPPKE